MCSTIVLGRGTHRALAFNYDYPLDHGLIGTNLRGVHKASEPPPGQAVTRWQVSHGNVTLCSFSLELPTCGINERGLCVALMWHEEGAFGSDASLPRLNPLQWIQYALDCHATVDEVIADLSRVQPRDDGVPLHFTILDAGGDCALIEFIAGEPRITRNPTFPAMTNSTYEYCLDAVSSDEVPDDATATSSLGRFETLHRLYTGSDHPADSAAAFALLRAANQGAGEDPSFPWSEPERRTRTVWSVLFEPHAGRIVFHTIRNPELREVRLDSLDLSERGTYQTLDIHEGVADIGGALQPYRIAENQRILRASAAVLGMPDDVLDEIARVVHRMYGAD